MKKCNTCRITKELTDYYQCGQGRYRAKCKVCEKSSKRYIAHHTGYDSPKAKKGKYQHSLTVKYGEGVAEMLAEHKRESIDVMKELQGY